MADTIMPPVHPGEILLTEFLEPLRVSQYQLVKAVDMPARRINHIVYGRRRISATRRCGSQCCPCWLVSFAGVGTSIGSSGRTRELLAQVAVTG